MKISVRIGYGEILSEIVIQKGILQEFCFAELIDSHLAIITDHHVRDLFGYSLQSRLKKEGFEAHLFSVNPGEESKCQKEKECLENQMFQAGLGRDTTLIALGGGVITDLAGFVASTFCRGIPYISIPTTLLGQVDASIGGKVGVNTLHGKNLIGSFHHPRYVLIDPEVLSTLPSHEYRNGMAEVIKYALIASQDLFEKLEENSSFEEYITPSCLIKKEVVEKDPREKGLRRILNFGHTIGHALEKVTNYRISHGEAVGVGLLAESRLSYLLGYLSENEFFRIQTLLEKYHFSLPSHIDQKQMIECMNLDKKALSNKPRFVLLEKIGTPLFFEGAYCSNIPSEMIKETVQWLCLR